MSAWSQRLGSQYLSLGHCAGQKHNYGGPWRDGLHDPGETYETTGSRPFKRSGLGGVRVAIDARQLIAMPKVFRPPKAAHDGHAALGSGEVYREALKARCIILVEGETGQTPQQI